MVLDYLRTGTEASPSERTMTSSIPVSTVPDGGYGWVIVFCSFMIHVMGPSMLLSLSVMYVAWLDEFGSGRGFTSWTVSLAFAVFLTEGPLVASLASRVGNQATVFCGAVLFSAGFCLSYFANSVEVLIVCIGFITGLGCGFTYLPAIASVANYFEKRRSLALGIATSGTGIGSFLLAPVYHWLILTYGWRGTLLIAGACQLNLCALALLMRPFKPTLYEKRVSIKHESASDLILNESLLKTNKGDTTEREYSQHLTSHLASEGEEFVGCHTNEDQTEYHVFASSGDPTGGNRDKRRGGSLVQLAPSSGGQSRTFSSATELRVKRGLRNNSIDRSHLALDVMMSGSLHSLSMIDKSGVVLRPNADASYSLRNQDTESVTKASLWHSCFSFFLSVITNFSLLKRLDFSLLIISNVLTNLSYLMPVLFMVDRATASGIDKASSASLVSVYGAGNVIGRLVCGFLGDRSMVDRTVCYVLILVVCGLATCLSPLCGSSIGLHGLYALIFGLTIGGFTTLVPVVTMDIVGVSLVGQSYGLVLLFSGIPGALGPPLAGFVYDWTSDYTASFVLHGVFVLLSAAVLLPVIIMKRARKQRLLATEAAAD